MRLNWTAELLSGNQRAGLPPYDPQHWIEQHRIESSDAIETFSALLLQNDVNAATLSLAQKLAGAAQQPNMPAALQVLLQTPEYQLA